MKHLIPRWIAARGNLLRDSILYTGSNAVNSAIPFLLLPILTRLLSPADFGVVAMFQLGVSILVPLIGLNGHSAIGRQYYEHEGIDFPAYVNSCLALAGLTVLPFLILSFTRNQMLSSLLGVPPSWLWALPVVALGQFVTAITLVHWQVRQEPLRFGGFRAVQTALNMGLSLLLITAFHLAWRGRVLGEVVATGAVGVATIFFLVRSGWVKRTPVRMIYMKHAAIYGGNLVPHTIGSLLITMSDRFLIKELIDVRSVGIYFAGYQIGMAISLLQNSFNQAWIPWLFERLKRNNDVDRREVVKVTYAYIVGIAGLAAGVALLAPYFVPFFLGPRYASSVVVVKWIAFGYAFNGMYKMVANYLYFTGQTYYLSVATVATGLFNVGLSYLLIQRNGLVGAAQAACISFSISFLATWWLSNRVCPMPWSLRSAGA